MRIHGLCLVKNEHDIVREGLKAARQWCDYIYVLDNGSTDGTWEIVREMSAADQGIVAWKQDDVVFSDALRCHIYHEFKGNAQRGDWWARVDPDEFYVEDPRQFLAAVPKRDGYVWYAPLTFYFSTEEARRFDADPSQFSDDVPIAEKCRHYFSHWSEPRFVRHEHMEPWRGEGEHFWPGWPERLLYSARSHQRRILCRHFSYRSPSQIELRLSTRAKSATRDGEFWHEAVSNWSEMFSPSSIRGRRLKHRWGDPEFQAHQFQPSGSGLRPDWRSRVIDVSELEYDAHDGKFVVNEHLMPPMARFHPLYYEWKDKVRSVLKRK